MFLLPFLKYFKPFRMRLALAMAGMIVVGVLSAAPLLVAREAIKVLLRSNEQLVTDLAQANEVSGSLKALIGSTAAADDATTATTAGAHGASSAPATLSLRQSIEARVETLTGGAYSRTRAAVGLRLQSLQTRYHDLSRRSPMGTLGVLVGFLILMTIAKGGAEFSSKYQLSYTFFFTNLQIREDIFGNVMRQDYLFFNRHSAGYLHSRINSDVKELRNILEGILSDGIQQPITLLVMFAILLWLSAKLTIGVIVILPVIGLLLYSFARVLRKNTRKQKKKADELSSSLTESLTNIRLVKAFGTEPVEIDKFHERSMALFRYMMAQRLVKFGASPVMEFLGSLAVAGVILFGGWMIVGGKMPFEDFVIFLATLSRFYRPIKNMATLTNKYQVARVSSERMIHMLNIQPQLQDAPDAVRFEALRDAIEFRDIAFSYGDGQVLQDIQLRVTAGQRVAFAGPSGSGKTTLVNLLVRLFDPSAGQILIDGVDLRRIRIKDWRNHLAIVTQETYLFDDTIANNIAYGSETVDRVRIEAAARAANAHEFIMDLDGGKGYGTVIGPMGTRLSGGQRQRLSIARAIYRDPKILILDEATSALDGQSQALVQNALNRLMDGRTTFIIAHRISTIRDVDCIYVLDQGRIVEHGTHDHLVAQGGLYSSMVAQTASATPLVDETLEEFVP